MHPTTAEMFALKRDVKEQGESIEKLVDSVDKLAMSVDRVMAAFPNGDVDGHRFYHLALIKKAEAWDKLASAIKEKTIIALVWAAIAWAGLAMWNEAVRHIPQIQRTQ